MLRTLLPWVCAGATLSCVGNIGERDGQGSAPPKDTLAGDCAAEPGPSPMRRLTRWEYDNTVHDLLGDTTRPASKFVPEAQQFGFDNGAAGATLNPLVVEQYEGAAIQLADSAIADLDALLACDAAASESECASTFIARVGRLLFRRPLAADEVDRFDAFYASSAAKHGHAQAVGLVLRAMLQSPHFLYRLEIGLADPAAPGALRLGPFEVASRLSYLLWGSAPDEELLQAAEAGELETPEQVAAQAERLLDDERGARAVKNFYAQWAQLGALASIDRPDTELTPEVAALLRAETETFVDEVVRKGDGKWSTLVGGSFTFMNAELAAFYGIDGPSGTAFERVELDPARYAGFMTQASMMAILAHPGQPSPVLRGKFVREQFLCTPPPPPPNDVDTTLPPIDPDATAREQLEQKTANPPCSGCHGFINPPGFAFEHFDELGRWRDTDHGLTIDASGNLDGTDVDAAFDDHTDLLALLAESEDVRSCLVLHWFRYAHGRDKTDQDDCTFGALDVAFGESGGDVRQLLVGLTQTPAFLYRSAHAGGAP